MTQHFHRRPLPALHAPYNTGPLLQGVPVRSKNVKTVAYDAASHLLQITFANGSTYDYLNVPEIVHRTLLDSPSKGSFVREGIATRFRAVKRPPEVTVKK